MAATSTSILELLGDRQIRFREADIPRPQSGEALIRITASAICTEAWFYTSAAHDPVTPGHEAVGIVEEINGPSTLALGQQVNIHGVWGCGRCEHCRAGRFTWCVQRLKMPGFHRQYMAVPLHLCLPIPNDVAPVAAALLSGCTFGLAYGSAMQFGPTAGKTIVVFGAGPVGLAQIVMQTWLGARAVAVDINDYRLELARQCGAVGVLNAQAPDYDQGLKALGAGTVDGCLVCIKEPAAVRQALEITRPRGQVMCIAEGLKLELDVSGPLLRKDISLSGHWFWFGCDLPRITAEYGKGLPIRKVLTHTIPMRQAKDAYEILASGRCGKIVLINE